jgi:hypothetical protein
MGFLKMLVGIVIIFWLLGFVLHIGGAMIHFLLVIAAIVFIFDLIGGKHK